VEAYDVVPMLTECKLVLMQENAPQEAIDLVQQAIYVLVDTCPDDMDCVRGSYHTGNCQHISL
jgi:hypothetical protein